MLVLSRKLGERIVIGRNIEVSVIDIRGGRVRLGVNAPLSVRVVRSEIHDRRETELMGTAEGSRPSPT